MASRFEPSQRNKVKEKNREKRKKIGFPIFNRESCISAKRNI